jgi:hypothetical protein
MINILFLVYEFPPLNSGGSHRPYRFTKYLKEFGINPIVVTPEVSNNQLDNSLLEELDDIKIIRTSVDKSVRFENIFSKSYINILDVEAKKWQKYLYQVLEKLTKEINFQAIYVTAPPFSIANLGVEVSKRFNLPLILDMRDHWSHWNITPFTSYLHYRLILQKERAWFNHASAVLAVSEQMVEDFRNIHPNIDKTKFHTVRNSYAKEIVDIKDTLSIRKPTKEKPLKIGYVGSFYYHPYQRDLIFNPWWKKKPHQWLQYTPRQEDWLYRSPYFFFKTLRRFINQYPDLSQLIKVEFIGAKPDWLIEMIKEFDLDSHVTLKGFVPHKESIEFQQNCDALLGTAMKVVGGRDYCIAGKSYEYMYQQKPILAFMTEGSQKEFFKNSGISLVFDADDTEKNIELFKNFIEGKIKFKPNREFMKQISTKETTKKLANIIKKAINL